MNTSETIVSSLDHMKNGWFVGHFSPAVLNSDHFEVAVKYSKKGDSEARHVHRVAREITVVAKGAIRMNGQVYNERDILLLPPNTPSDLQALEDSITVVVKTPSLPNDKFNC